MELKNSVVQRISKYLDDPKEDCIIYPILNSEGYGVMQSTLNGKKVHYLMHRVAYQVYYKDNIDSNDIICHKCDNPACVNPLHLFKGSHSDNVQDKVSKGRQAKGKDNGRYIDGRSSFKVKSDQSKAHNRKLTKEQVLEVRELRMSHTMRVISELTGISISSIKDICSGRTYSCY